MTVRKLAQLSALASAVSISLFAQTDRLAAGTELTVRTNESIDAKSSNEGRIYSGVVDRDVLDRTGRTVIPRGSDVELTVRDVSSREVMLDLESVNVSGRRYTVSTSDQAYSANTRKDGIGKNKRTGKYLGGGAAIGSIIGAIAGGGKGAAIGAATGAAAGGVTQTATRGGSVKVPAETVLTFRLDRPLSIGSADSGYMRDGRHYHPNDGR